MFSYTKTTNESTASNNKSQTTGEHSGQLKDLEISKYKRDSKARMPKKIVV